MSARLEGSAGQRADKTQRSEVARRAGLLGAVLGAVAAGVAAAAATQRAVVRRAKRRDPDPYLEEPFGRQPFDESLVVTAADGTDIYVEIVEPRVRPAGGRKPVTLVLVHGFCLEMGSYHFQRRALADHGFRLVLYDQPGHGRSGRLESGDYEFPELAAALRAVIDQTTPDGPLVLVGHSMGGMTLMAFAERYPELFGDRVVGTVLIATSGALIDEVKPGPSALISRFAAPLLPLARNTTRFTGGLIDRSRQAASDLAWLLTRRYAFGGPRPSPTLVSFVERMNSATSVDTVVRYMQALYTHARYPALAALRATPTLIIVGEQDRIIPTSHSEEIARRLPEAGFVRIPDSGHMVMLEHPDEVNAALVDFLDGLMR